MELEVALIALEQAGQVDPEEVGQVDPEQAGQVDPAEVGHVDSVGSVVEALQLELVASLTVVDLVPKQERNSLDMTEGYYNFVEDMLPASAAD